MIADISGPDHNYTRYWKDTKVELGTQKTTYTYVFQMTGSDDANGRLEFNLGNAASTAAVHLSMCALKRPDMKKSKKIPQRKCLQTEIMSTTVPSRKEESSGLLGHHETGKCNHRGNRSGRWTPSESGKPKRNCGNSRTAGACSERGYKICAQFFGAGKRSRNYDSTCCRTEISGRTYQ